MFGPALPIEIINDIGTPRECFDSCHNKDNCTHYSWNQNITNSNQSSCHILATSNDKQSDKIKSIQYFCENKGSLLGRREFLCQKADQNSYSWIVTKTHKLRDASRYSNDSINLAQCWRDFCRGCSFFSWNQDKKECNVSNENTEVCKTQRGSECSQIIEEIPDFTTVRANNCKEKIMSDDSDCKWEDDLPISMDTAYRLKLVLFSALRHSNCEC